MAIIDPSPTTDELQALVDCLKSVAASISAYLKTPAGQQDQNFIQLSTAALDLYVDADNIADQELQLAVADGGQAVDVINAATSGLQHAIQVRADITKDLQMVANVAAFAAAIATRNVGSIISSGKTLIKSL